MPFDGARAREGAILAELPDETRQQIERFLAALTSEERMLIVLKSDLYEGRWDEMVEDLRARLDGRPYVFKLAHRIEDDLARIEKLRDFEQRMGVDLGDYVKLET